MVMASLSLSRSLILCRHHLLLSCSNVCGSSIYFKRGLSRCRVAGGMAGTLASALNADFTVSFSSWSLCSFNRFSEGSGRISNLQELNGRAENIRVSRRSWKAATIAEEGSSAISLISSKSVENDSLSDILDRHAHPPSRYDPQESGDSPRECHNKSQSEFFDENSDFFSRPVPPDVDEKLAEIVKASGVAAGCRVLDCGAGTGPLIPHIFRNGADDITAVDLSPMMIAELKEQFDSVCCWNGDINDLPEDYGPFDVLFFNAMFGNVHSQTEALKSAVRLTAPGARILLSHPLGAPFVERLHMESPLVVPHLLPNREALQPMAEEAGLEIIEFRDEADFYLAVLKVKPSDAGVASSAADEQYKFWKAPLQLRGPVVYGFGRGSRQMGVPTANLPPEQLESELEGVEKGVYFGWAQVPELDGSVHKMVMNVGQRPTFADSAGLSVEVHILHDFGADFYGKDMRVLVLGFIRPEMPFNSLDSLVKRIHEDIGIARRELDLRHNAVKGSDPFFALD